MDDERLLKSLFEAARTEPTVRSIDAVKHVFQATTASTSSGLIIKWLKQNKMNMLITTSGLVITTTILLFPRQEMKEKKVSPIIEEVPFEYVEQKENVPEISKNEVEELNNAEKDFRQALEEEEEKEDGVDEAEMVSLPEEEEASAIDMKSEGVTEHEVVDVKQESTVSIFSDYAIVLESNKGRSSVVVFDEYLKNNLSQLKHEFTSTSNQTEIKKFSLKLDNRYEASFRMQVSGFDKLELQWEANEEGEIRNMWYRLDKKEIKKLDFSKSSKFSVRVKYKHQEF